PAPLRRGPAGFPDGSDSSPFSKERLARDEGRSPLLGALARMRAGQPCHPQAAITMPPFPEVDRPFPLSSGSSERMRLRAPHLLAATDAAPSFVMGNRAFIRMWAARRAAMRSGVGSIAEVGEQAEAPKSSS